MSGNGAGLTARAREFVGVGASVGAGCHPCVTHHIKAGSQAGIDSAGLLAAITAAERVTADAAARMAQHTRRQVHARVGAALDVSAAEATLAALGAAVAANSMPNIESLLGDAAELGLTHDELVEAVQVAHQVQTNAARIHASQTEKLLVARQAQDPPDGCDEGCPCHDENTGTEVTAGAASAAGSPAFGCADSVGGQEEPPARDKDDAHPDVGVDLGSMVGSCMPGQADTFIGCCIAGSW